MIFPRSRRNLLPKWAIAISMGSAALLNNACYPQSAQTPAVRPQNMPGQAATVPTPAPSSAPTMASDPAPGLPAQKATATTAASGVTRPATVSLHDGQLFVEANNSELSQILQNLASISGMSIDGLRGGPRVFGVYGPGNSREVLSALLVGSGYNFIMVGGAPDGAPRKLMLTPQKRNAAGPNDSRSTPDASDDADEPDQPEPPDAPSASAPDQPGPGAAPPVPSQDSQDSQDDEGTRMQKSLQQLRQQQPITPPQ